MGGPPKGKRKSPTTSDEKKKSKMPAKLGARPKMPAKVGQRADYGDGYIVNKEPWWRVVVYGKEVKRQWDLIAESVVMEHELPPRTKASIEDQLQRMLKPAKEKADVYMPGDSEKRGGKKETQAAAVPAAAAAAGEKPRGVGLGCRGFTCFGLRGGVKKVLCSRCGPSK